MAHQSGIWYAFTAQVAILAEMIKTSWVLSMENCDSAHFFFLISRSFAPKNICGINSTIVDLLENF